MCEGQATDPTDESRDDTEIVYCPECGAEIERADPPPLPIYRCPECDAEICPI